MIQARLKPAGNILPVLSPPVTAGGMKMQLAKLLGHKSCFSDPKLHKPYSTPQCQVLHSPDLQASVEKMQ